MATLPAHLFLTVGSQHDAAVQLLYKLPGSYRLIRRTHYTNVVNGTNLLYRDLICPSHGISQLILRAPKDRQYEMELVQTTTIYLRSWGGRSATIIEKRAFRISNGRWSMWNVDNVQGEDIVGSKVADLMLREMAAPKDVAGNGLQEARLHGGPWEDTLGTNSLTICVWVGRQLCWQSMHQIDRPGGRQVPSISQSCSDEFWPAVEGRVEEGGR